MEAPSKFHGRRRHRFPQVFFYLIVSKPEKLLFEFPHNAGYALDDERGLFGGIQYCTDWRRRVYKLVCGTLYTPGPTIETP